MSPAHWELAAVTYALDADRWQLDGGPLPVYHPARISHGLENYGELVLYCYLMREFTTTPEEA